MRNATCVETQTSKVPTRVAILFISILWLKRTRYKERNMANLTSSDEDESLFITQNMLRAEATNESKYEQEGHFNMTN